MSRKNLLSPRYRLMGNPLGGRRLVSSTNLRNRSIVVMAIRMADKGTGVIRPLVGNPTRPGGPETIRSHDIDVEVHQPLAVTVADVAPMPCEVWQTEQEVPTVLTCKE